MADKKLIIVKVNAYRGSDAINAVRQQCRKENRVTSEYAAHLTDRMTDETVAIVVTRDAFGPVSANLRRTYDVSFWYHGQKG